MHLDIVTSVCFVSLSAVPCIYDITICYRDNKEPTLVGVVNAEPCRADMMVRRYPVSDIDTSSEEAMSEWLVNLFKDKVRDGQWVG